MVRRTLIVSFLFAAIFLFLIVVVAALYGNALALQWCILLLLIQIVVEYRDYIRK